MASARPADAPPDSLTLLARALLFSSEKKKKLYCEVVAASVSESVTATALAALVSARLRVSEPTARRAVRKLKRFGLIRAENGFPVSLTPLGEKIFEKNLGEREVF